MSVIVTAFSFRGEHTFSTDCVRLSISIVIDSDTDSSFRLCWQLTQHTALHRGNPEDCADLVSINYLLVITTDNGFKVLTFFGIYQLLDYLMLLCFTLLPICFVVHVLYDDINISQMSPSQ